ncbi:unnamed protein product, partial [marine sediment metagenome]
LLFKIYKELKKPTLKAVARGIPFQDDKVYQFTTIAPGAYGVVYSYDNNEWPRTGSVPFVAFIRRVGCNWFANTRYYWRIDGQLKELVQRVIGSPAGPTNSPMNLSDPLIAYEKIEWVAYNGDTVPHVFEVLNDGVLYPAEVAKLLEGSESSVSHPR